MTKRIDIWRLPLVLVGIAILSWTNACRQEPTSEPGEKVDILVRGAAVITMDGSFTVHRPGFVAIRGDQIVAVGPQTDAKKYSASSELASNGIVLPGLVNGHQHAAMVLLRGLADDRNLMDWLRQYIFPAEAKNVDPDFVYWGTLLAAVEMVQSGTTTYADMYYFEDKVAEATSKVGMRGVLGQTIIGFPAPDHKTPEETLVATEEFVKRWKGDRLIVPAVAPHAPYTCSKEILLASRALADKYDVPLLTHLAETEDEVNQIRSRTGTTPTRYLKDIGFLCDRLVAAHAVWVDPEEIAILKEFGVGVIHNPESNMKLASGVAPIPEMLRAGIDVGLGTDGAASNNNLDMFQEMDTMAKLHKLFRKDPTLISSREALSAATIGSAKALGMGDRLGSLEVGKKADLVILNRRDAASWPLYDPHSSAVYALLGGSVDTVLVDGRVVMRARQFPDLDRRELLRQVQSFQQKIRRSLAKPAGN